MPRTPVSLVQSALQVVFIVSLIGPVGKRNGFLRRMGRFYTQKEMGLRARGSSTGPLRGTGPAQHARCVTPDSLGAMFQRAIPRIADNPPARRCRRRSNSGPALT